MVTFHPTAKRTQGGYKPMICIRKVDGTLYGSRTGTDVFASKSDATSEALYRALRAAAMVPAFARVA